MLRRTRRLKRVNPVVVFALLGIIALGTLGTGYAAWTDSLGSTGTVTTGTLDMRFTEGSSVAASESTVGHCTLAREDKKLTVVIDHGYPDYTCTLTMQMKNVGTLPAVAYATAEIAAASQLDWNVANCQSLVDHSTVFQPNETKSCTAVVKVKQAASQGADYTFSLRLDFQNWHP